MKKMLSLVLILCLCCLGAQAQGLTLTDMTGRQVTLDAPATRVVALTAADCEILYALGAGDVLVGRGTYCDYPQAILDVPVVESGAQTNLEQIVALSPQVVLMSTMAQSLELLDALESAGIQVVETQATDIQGVYEAIRLIGQTVGKDEQAQALAADMEAAFAQIATDNTGKTVYFEVSPLEWGLWTAGKGTFMDELATLCGLTNAFSDVAGWAQVSQEQVLERDPDYIVTVAMYSGEGPTPADEIMGRTGWDQVRAVADGHVFMADNDQITRPGPRLVDAARALLAFVGE